MHATATSVAGRRRKKGESEDLPCSAYHSIFRRKRDEYIGTVILPVFLAFYFRNKVSREELRTFRTITTLLLLFSGAGFSYAQVEPDTILLKPVVIESGRNSLFLAGKATITIDSSTTATSPGAGLDDILSTNTSIFIKSYGAGSSSVLSSRGTEARHSSVLWNGFNLNAAGLGMTDLSIIPASISDEITLIKGGSSPVNGNAALGSTILLQRPAPVFEKKSGLTIGAETGSFDQHHLSVQSGISGLKTSHSTRVFYNSATNDFKFTNTAEKNHPVEKLEHAKTRDYGLIQYSDFRVSEKSVVTSSLWYQTTSREIPPMMTALRSEAEQRDSILRVHAGFKTHFGKSFVSFNAGYFREHMQYDDFFYNIHSRYFVSTMIGDAEYRFRFNPKLLVSAGATGTSSRASFKEYHSGKERNQLSVFTAFGWNPFAGWNFNFNLRSEFTNVTSPPLCPSLGFEGNLYRHKVELLFNAGRHYSLPSMNDLYWHPGGNENLLPEDALSAECGLRFFRDNGRLPEITLMSFISQTDNWIKWVPGPGGIYTPENISVVESKGVELSVKQSWLAGLWKFKTGVDYTWCISEVSETGEPMQELLTGKQIMYSPNHVTAVFLDAAYRESGVRIIYHYTGERYTTADESAFLDAYQTTDIHFYGKIKKRKNNYLLFVKILNVFDESYQYMAWRPAPGRSFHAGFKLNLNFKS